MLKSHVILSSVVNYFLLFLDLISKPPALTELGEKKRRDRETILSNNSETVRRLEEWREEKVICEPADRTDLI